MSIENKGKPLGTVVYSDEGNDTLYAFKQGVYTPYAFKQGVYTPYATLTNNTGEPTGVLITKP